MQWFCVDCFYLKKSIKEPARLRLPVLILLPKAGSNVILSQPRNSARVFLATIPIVPHASCPIVRMGSLAISGIVYSRYRFPVTRRRTLTKPRRIVRIATRTDAFCYYLCCLHNYFPIFCFVKIVCAQLHLILIQQTGFSVNRNSRSVPLTLFWI